MTQNRTLFSVREITANIRQFLEAKFSRIGVRGEVSSFTCHASGHWYFNLKDSSAQISAVMFRSANQKVTFQPKVGEEIILWGRITVYEPRGAYQILADRMEKVGDGALQKAFEQLKVKLKNEGLFDRKKPLPYLPRHIAIVTALTGAALRDVLSVLNRRSKGIRITVVPALMEGAQATVSIQMALKQAWKLKDLDLVLITRGGGSAESLWVFNDEALARLAVQCPVPLVSAIGHEIDFTIMDFIADLRAPTPSSAAEMISKNNVELLEKIQNHRKNLIYNLKRFIQQKVKELGRCRKTFTSPLSKIEDALLKCDDYILRMEQNVKNLLELKKHLLHKLKDVLIQLDPEQIMSRGYSLCFKEGRVIRSANELTPKDLVNIRFFKGQATAQITKKGKA